MRFSRYFHEFYNEVLGSGVVRFEDDEIAEMKSIQKDKHIRGYRDYGDRSFDIPLDDLLSETMDECRDIPGWLLLAYDKERSGQCRQDVLCEITRIARYGFIVGQHITWLRQRLSQRVWERPQKGMAGNPITGEEYLNGLDGEHHKDIIRDR